LPAPPTPMALGQPGKQKASLDIEGDTVIPDCHRRPFVRPWRIRAPRPG
jgi:hypothetical protein